MIKFLVSMILAFVLALSISVAHTDSVAGPDVTVWTGFKKLLECKTESKAKMILYRWIWNGESTESYKIETSDTGITQLFNNPDFDAVKGKFWVGCLVLQTEKKTEQQ